MEELSDSRFHNKKTRREFIREAALAGTAVALALYAVNKDKTHKPSSESSFTIESSKTIFNIKSRYKPSYLTPVLTEGIWKDLSGKENPSKEQQ